MAFLSCMEILRLSWWIMFIVSLKTNANTIVGDIYLSLEYFNEDSKDSNGNICDYYSKSRQCDAFFKLCASSYPKNDCDMLNEITTPRWNEKSILYASESAFKGSMFLSSPNIFSLAIEIWDFDNGSEHDLIGKLENKQIHIRDVQWNSTRIGLVRTDLPRRNHFRLEAAMWKKCRRNYFGNLCQTFCRSSSADSYCHTNGTLLCHSGYECQRASDPCSKSPCKNNGVCIQNERSFSCKCTDGWVGLLCDEPVIFSNPCKDSPCNNDGVCIMQNSMSFSCNCTKEWSGPLCDESVELDLKFALPTSILIIFAVTLAILGIIYRKIWIEKKRTAPSPFYIIEREEEIYDTIGQPYFFPTPQQLAELARPLFKKRKHLDSDPWDAPPVPPRTFNSSNSSAPVTYATIFSGTDTPHIVSEERT